MNSSSDAHSDADTPRVETENKVATSGDDQALAQAETTLAALDTLEEMLADRKSDEAETYSSPRMEQDGQYNIPLLDEVVLPGDETVGTATDRIASRLVARSATAVRPVGE